MFIDEQTSFVERWWTHSGVKHHSTCATTVSAIGSRWCVTSRTVFDTPLGRLLPVATPGTWVFIYNTILHTRTRPLLACRGTKSIMVPCRCNTPNMVRTHNQEWETTSYRVEPQSTGHHKCCTSAATTRVWHAAAMAISQPNQATILQLHLLPLEQNTLWTMVEWYAHPRLAAQLCQHVGEQWRTLYEVQHLLGHKRAHTTERYAHLANTRLIKAASLIDKAYE